MIDVESQIYTLVRNAIVAEYPDAKISSTLDLSPSEFPSVSIEEIGNTSLESTITSTSNENHATISYEINVWSIKTAGRKAEAKAILAIADTLLLDLNFIRTNTNPVQIDDGTKYRLIARYSAVVDKNETIYRR